MKQRCVKIIVCIIILTMVLTSFSFLAFLPMMFGDASPAAYGAVAETRDVDKELSLLKEYIELIHDNYREEVDYDTLIDGAFRGVAESLGDPFSEYYKNRQESNAFTTSVDGSFEGIGVNIQMQDGQCTVTAPIAGGPAARAGIQSGDVITKVDGTSVKNLSLTETANLLRGEKGSTVTVTVLRSGKELSFTMQRETVQSECVSSKMLDGKIGYIAMNGFDNDAALEFKKARIRLINQGAKSLILDLRDNPGGYVDMAINIADQILEKGDISHFESRGKLIKTYSATDTESVSLPIVLLVNENTASSSEILAAALADNHAAVLVGTTTYGKGIAQQIAYLDSEKALKLSVYQFLSPDKHVIHGVGITPDYVIPDESADAETEAEYRSFAPMSEEAKPAVGDTGLNVYGAQQRLLLLGYRVKVTGTMDEATAAAVKAFQKQSGLYAYGVLDRTTAAKLDEAALRFALGKSEEDPQLAEAVRLLSNY